MSASMLSIECRRTVVDLPGDLGQMVSEPEHDRCSGGETREGVMGGWICSCDCHRAASVPVPEEDEK